MSTTARSTPRGGKNNKTEAASTPKTQKSDTNKSESPKVIGLDKSQVPTAEQMRMAEIMDTKKDDLALKDKIKQVMDATQKTEDEVCTALHDCDNDANRAVNYLLEGSIKNEWSTSVVKKKKNRTASSNKAEATTNNHVGGSGEGEDWDERGPEVSSGGGRGRDRARQRGSGPPRLRGRGSLESRGWRGRENKENERNLEDNFNSDRGRRGERGGRMSNGPGRGGRGGRGGGRLGSRTFQRGDKPSGGFPRSIDTWNNPSTDDGSGEKMENWDANGAEDWDAEDYKNKPHENWDGFPSPEDWDNEEYTGSLADSKVFTPSSGPEPTSTQPPVDQDKLEELVGDQPSQPPVLETQQPPRPVQMPPSPVGVNTLTPAQSQYLSQLTQQSSDYKSAVSLTQSSQPQPQQYPATYPAPSVAYSSSYGVNNSYNSPLQDGTATSSTQPLPARTKPQKPRVPPPSKIPSSAVEMPPGDAIAVALLDVQFGGLEFGSDSSSLETSTTMDVTNSTTTVPSSAPTPTPSAPTPTTVAASVATIMESYATSVSNTQQQTNLANALAQTQKLTSGESMLPDVVVTLTNSFAGQSTTRPVNTAASSVLTELTNSTAKSSAVDSTLSYSSTDSALYQSQSYQKTSAAASYPTPTPVSTYNSSSYSTSQVTSSTTGYSSQTTGYTNSYGSGSSVTQSAPSYPSYSSNQTSYAYTSYPANNYHSGGQTYPPQSYQSSGTTYPGSYQNSSYPPSGGQQNHKINTALGSSQGKDSQYESGQVTSNSVPAVSTVSSTPSLGLSATSQTAVSTKVAGLSTANKSGIVAGIPPQVPPMINTHQYIMGQAAGLPYFQQPMFSYDDALMLQQRIAAPPLPTGYFDMSFQQQPTSLGAAGRDASLANVAYSMSDGRFARADNASPVPSTLSQNVTQGHQQPMLNPAGLPPGYTYIYSGYPTNFQYSTPALYPMAPTAAAGNSTSSQYKGPGYGSAANYSSGYEASADGYKVGSAAGYTGTPQTKAGGTPTTSTDLTQNMYTKGHATLNKVNSYDKAGFHSGTPPPFNLTGSQTGLAPSGTFTPHLFISPLPPHQQHHSGATLMHQPLHQIEMRNHGRRMDGATNSGPRTQATSQPNKAGTKQQNYSPSFWAATS